jgi:hypothetical protein
VGPIPIARFLTTKEKSFFIFNFSFSSCLCVLVANAKSSRNKDLNLIGPITPQQRQAYRKKILKIFKKNPFLC